MVLMHRKIALAALLLVGQQAYCGTMGAQNTPYNGAYIGGTLGVVNLINPTNTTYPLAAHQMGDTGVLGGGLIGYDYSVSETIKVGFEGFANAIGLDSSSIQLYDPVTSYRVQSRYNFGARVLPGYQLPGGAVGYVVLGYTNNGYKITDDGDYGYINQSGNTNGFQCGLGMKTPLKGRLSLRADALYSIYQSTSNTGLSNLTPPGPQIYNNNFSTLEGDLTLLYKFN